MNMENILKIQYQLTCQSRRHMLDFLTKTVQSDCNKKLKSHNGCSINDILSHVAACYINWIDIFALKRTLQDVYFDSLFLKVDNAVNDFLDHFEFKLNVPIRGVHDACGSLAATPAEIFTHVLTHEFHHKGQIMNMCRNLGYLPPETDISLFFDYSIIT